MFSIEGFSVVIVGGSRGIGSALVRGFVSANAKVTILDIETPSITEGVKRIRARRV